MLARFLADPYRVRVGLKATPHGWRATVAARNLTGPTIEQFASSPSLAMRLAIQAAEDIGIPGVDLSMGWAYQHPFNRSP